MRKDIVADGLNQIMNAKKASKNKILLEANSKVLTSVLAIGKLKGYIKNYSSKGNQVEVEIDHNLNFCKAIKPRFLIKKHQIQKYVERYLPARGIGVLIISTSQGLMTHQTAQEKGIGGSLLAYFY